MGAGCAHLPATEGTPLIIEVLHKHYVKLRGKNCEIERFASQTNHGTNRVKAGTKCNVYAIGSLSAGSRGRNKLDNDGDIGFQHYQPRCWNMPEYDRLRDAREVSLQSCDNIVCCLLLLALILHRFQAL